MNPYDRRIVADSILKIKKVNTDEASGRRRRLLGFAVSAKRYALYERSGEAVTMVDPKAHGLGYLYLPKAKGKDAEPDWTAEAWEWMVRRFLGLTANAPTWLDAPSMMRVSVSTPALLRRLNQIAAPFTFLLCPLIDHAGRPYGVEREHFTIVMPFTKQWRAWLQTPCLGIHDGKTYRLAREQTLAHNRVIPQDGCGLAAVSVPDRGQIARA